MTTIAASLTHRQMAADSRCSDGNLHFQVTKIHVHNSTLVGVAGDWGHCLRFINYLKAKEALDLEVDADFDALQLTENGIYAWDAATLTRFIVKDQFMAIGSGALAALGAMEMGASPEEAIRIAAKYDPDTAAPIDVYTLPVKKKKLKEKLVEAFSTVGETQ